MRWNWRPLACVSVLLVFLCPGMARAAEQASPTSATVTVASLKSDPSLKPDASLSSREKEWFQKFMHGTMFCSGWLDTTEMILDKVGPDQRAILAPLLDELGRRIGREWAKDNNQRRIDTSMLKTWGNLLKKTARKEPEKLVAVISEISAEVDRLLR